MKTPNPTKRILTRAFLTLLLTCLITNQTLSKGKSPSNDIKSVAHVLQQFKGKQLSECVTLLDILRPAAVSPEGKQSLKEAGFPLIDINTEITDAEKLNSLYARTNKVLQFHHREGIVEYIIFHHDQPIVMTKAGAYIALATKTLKLAQSNEELAGIIAHELSHEYVALDVYKAIQTQDFSKLRELELLCDAYTVITLLHLGIDPNNYSRILTKIINHSPESQELNNGTYGSPSLESRLTLILELKKILKPSELRTHHPTQSP